MAGKKKDLAIQKELESQEEFEEMLTQEGLIVVDVYQEWAGPCKAMVSFLRRLKLELSDDYLHFATAKADTIDALEKYRGKCIPCFLFYAGGSLVAAVRGANVPMIEKTLKEQLAQEHKVMEGIAERKEIRDTALGEDDKDKEKGGLDEEENEKEEAPKKEVTVAIIKPDAVKAGKVEEILEQMKEAGIEVLAQEERQLTDEEAREFYSAQQEQEHFEELVNFMSSGPSHVLVLTKGSGEGIIQEWRDLLGPTSVEEAKEQAPDSLRAKFGSEKYFNALHGSDSQDTATRELAFFFPNFAVPGSAAPKSAAKPKVQRTLALIRPDALTEHKDAILEKIKEAGFMVAMQKEVQLSKEEAEEFYKEHKDQPYFEELTNRMSNGPLLALSLARDEAVEAWRGMLGPKEVDKAKEEAPDSLRAQFAVEGVDINPVHGSDSPQTAEQELEYFFPMQQTLAVIKPDAYQTKDEIMDKIKEAGFHIAARKETELTADIVQQLYKEHEGKEYFGDLVDHMTSGPTLFMVLSKENAVEGWRGVIGPTDPAQAKEEAPDSIRAQFGSDVKANAVHGSSNVDHAKEAIQAIFGDLVFEKDGTIKGEEEISTEQTEEAAAEQQASEEGAPAAEEGEVKAAEETTAGENIEQPSSDQEDEISQTPSNEEQNETQGGEEQAQAPADDAEQKPAEGEEQAPAADEQKPAEGEEQTPTTDEQAPATDEQAPATDEQAPAAEEQAAVTDEQAPAAEEQAPVADEQAPATDEQAPVADEQAAVTDEQAPVADEQKPAEATETPSTEATETPAGNKETASETPAAADAGDESQKEAAPPSAATSDGAAADKKESATPAADEKKGDEAPKE